jgi:hypothetical protein
MGKVIPLYHDSLARKIDIRQDDWSSMVKSVNKNNTYKENLGREYIKAYMKLLSI